jgi:hypothetical protein
MDEKQGPAGVYQDRLHERLIHVRGETALYNLKKQAAVDHAVHASQQEVLTSPREAGKAEPPWFAEYLHGRVAYR